MLGSTKQGQELQFDSASWKGLRETQLRAHNARLASIQNRKHVMYECEPNYWDDGMCWQVNQENNYYFRIIFFKFCYA